MGIKIISDTHSSQEIAQLFLLPISQFQSPQTPHPCQYRNSKSIHPSEITPKTAPQADVNHGQL